MMLWGNFLASTVYILKKIFKICLNIKNIVITVIAQTISNVVERVKVKPLQRAKGVEINMPKIKCKNLLHPIFHKSAPRGCPLL